MPKKCWSILLPNIICISFPMVSGSCQSRKMRSAGVDRYFKKIILSEDLGVLKPWPEIFHFALSATQSELRESLMIGDSWEADMTGAHGVGMHQAFYNVTERTVFPFSLPIIFIL